MGQDLAPIAEEDEWRCVECTVMRRPGSLSSRKHVLVGAPDALLVALRGSSTVCIFLVCWRLERITFIALYRLACRKGTGV